MTFPIYIEIFCWGNAQCILYLSMLTKAINTVDFIETQHKAQTLRKNSMSFKKITLRMSQVRQCLCVSEDLGLVTSSWNLKCSQCQYSISLDFDVF